MRTGRGGIEHLHEVGGGARRGERLEHGVEHPRPTEPPEALPDGVPIPELGRQSPPSDVVNGEIMKRLPETCGRPGPCRPGAAAPPGTPSGPHPNLPRSSASASPAPSDRASACLNMVNKLLIPSTRPSLGTEDAGPDPRCDWPSH